MIIQGESMSQLESYMSLITLKVPSGKIIVNDSLRPVYDWDGNDPKFASYNTPLGQQQVVAHMAEKGCAFGPVGNTCPGLYQTGEGTYVIASPAWDEDTGEEIVPSDWEFLAGIITDLWAYSIADYEDWQARGGSLDLVSPGHTIVSIPPGEYAFCHHTGEMSFDPDAAGTVIFAHVWRTG